jgi:hypothetical protein
MTELLRQELRGGWLGVGKAYQPLDALGMALGAYFLYAGATKKAPDWLTATLGGVMIFIHAQRFLYAPKDRAGLIRLAKTLKLTQKDFDVIEQELKL